ncbi:hypothetical protein A1O7_04094 [Cladophialophora yegresii CBS 114405]|uniref:DUF7514 domain-containing protein n=1 Tax=Cladophialophora yegresii CBS 114405 TaxID=1182544 RepID=W9W5Z2_9EURO|nr:uncharacterized protein A1O7_04094 [Cladophialophora yegresii CBS 114405]EXJ59946.1 hypothetical protein A1O7_04094 [Cladophialophora yegresii CBS 114405]
MMDQTQAAPGFWRYLINPDKSATPQFEQLCVGIAKVIATLEPGPNSELTPSRLAAFYRAVGGNYDALFLRSSDHALSFMFQTLGCYHSLQPTPSPFETPRIPCLTPIGFARWQTIQLLLCPEENVGFVQKAVQLWKVPTPNGDTYPTYIPNEMFPDRPDEAMEKWYRMVTGKLNQQNYNLRRIKNSPYQSPHPEPYDPREGYFSGAQVGRPARPSRSNSRDDDQLAALYRRRSSVPDFPSPSGDRGSHWDPRSHQRVNDLKPLAKSPAISSHHQAVHRVVDTRLLPLNHQGDDHRLVTTWHTALPRVLPRRLMKTVAVKGAQRLHKRDGIIANPMRTERLVVLPSGRRRSCDHHTNGVIRQMQVTVHLALDRAHHSRYGQSTTHLLRPTLHPSHKHRFIEGRALLHNGVI